jgi:hypothetical protein
MGGLTRKHSRFVAVVGSLAAVGVGLVLMLGVVGGHSYLMYRASLSCPEVSGRLGTPTTGGYFSGPTCEYGLGGDADAHPPERGDLNVLRPWWSAVGSVVALVAIATLVALVVRRLNRWRAGPVRDGAIAGVI